VEETSRRPLIAALISDLFFRAKVESAAENLEIELKLVSSPDLFSETDSETCSLVIVDLTLKPGAVDKILAEVRNLFPESRLIAYGPHVEKDLMRKARSAGADEVIPRSRFSRELPKILRSAIE
jgi:DNA-binding NarL/FixJ family response regulator